MISSSYVYISAPDSNLECPICREPLVDPVMLPCHHIFCHFCLEKHVSTIMSNIDLDPLESALTCPVDRTSFIQDEVTSAPTMVRTMLDDLKVECVTPHCKWTGKRGELSAHLDRGCPPSPLESTSDKLTIECKWSKEGCIWKHNSFPSERDDASTSTSLVPSACLRLEEHLETCPYQHLSPFIRSQRQRLAELSLEASNERSARLALSQAHARTEARMMENIRSLQEEIKLVNHNREEERMAVTEDISSLHALIHDLRVELELIKSSQITPPLSSLATSSGSSGGSEGEDEETAVKIIEPKVWVTRYPPAKLPRPPPPLGYWNFVGKGREKMKL